MENIQRNFEKNIKKKRYRRRCNNCKERITLYIFKRNGKLFCRCPKCGVEGRFFKEKKT